MNTMDIHQRARPEVIRASDAITLVALVDQKFALDQHAIVAITDVQGSTFSFAIPVFSLSNAISPLLMNDRWPAESIAVLRVAAQPSRTEPEFFRELRGLVSGCLVSDVAVLLPKMSGRTGEELFVAAFTDEEGDPFCVAAFMSSLKSSSPEGSKAASLSQYPTLC